MTPLVANAPLSYGAFEMTVDTDVPLLLDSGHLRVAGGDPRTALGDGDVDLAGFCAAVERTGYGGWVVVEQDRVLADANGAFGAAASEQAANRAWLREHAGW